MEKHLTLKKENNQNPKEMGRVLSMKIAESGHSIVMIILLENQEEIVLKPCQETSTALFFNEVAKLLGVATSQITYLTKNDHQLQTLQQAIKVKLEEDGQDLFAKLGNSFTSIFYQISQYIPSVGFSECPQNYLQCLPNDQLAQLGITLAFDLIINNNDRFQAVWEGQGNFDNILVEIESSENFYFGRFVFIDHIGNLCNMENCFAAENAKKYFKKIDAFYREVIALKDILSSQDNRMSIDELTKPIYFGRFINQLQTQTQSILSKAQVLVVIDALLGTTQAFFKELQAGTISAILERIKNQGNMSDAYRYLWKEELKSINLNFCYQFSKLVNPIIQHLR